jgi:hypothetical protein
MTTPWPAFDSETQTVLCCLCFESKRLDELSRDADGDLTDVCLVCRQKELQAVLAQIVVILATDDQLVDSQRSNCETTQVIPQMITGKWGTTR